MAYIGKSPDGTGVRARYYFTATGGETSLSGADDNAVTLSFADGAYVDVYLNGVLLVAGTDYNTTTTNTISGLSSLAANDIVEILVYDIFTVADTVSASAGGTFSGAVAMANGLTVDDDGAAPLTLDRATSGGAIVDVQKDGSSVGTIAEKDGEITIGSGDVGLRFYAAGDAVIPVTSTNQEVRDNAIDLGGSSYRFNDLYLGGGAYIGGTAAANHLDDYEEGTYTPVISATDGIGTLTYSAQVGRYTKVGNRVSFNAYISIANKGTVAGSLRITLPFTVKNVANNNTVFSWWINSAVSGQRFDGDTMQFCFATPNSSIALPYGSNGAGGVDLLNAAHVQNGTDMMVGGTYEV